MKNWDDVKQSISSIPDDEKYALEVTAYLVSKLIDKRHEMGLTQDQLAKITGLKQSAIARIETARVIPKVDTIQTLARGLGLKLELVDEQAAAFVI